MGVSAEQHRAVIGYYAAKLWSSEWKPGLSKSRIKKTSKGKKSPPGLTLILFATISLVMMDTSRSILSSISIPASSYHPVCNPSWTCCPLLQDPTTVHVQNPALNKLLFLCAGDVETNPGPEVIEEEKTLEQSMAIQSEIILRSKYDDCQICKVGQVADVGRETEVVVYTRNDIR